MTQPASRYTRTAIALHWIMALGLIAAVVVGWWAAGLPLGPQRMRSLNYHKWAGVSLLLLALIRLAWRWRHPPPPALSMPPLQLRVTHGVHQALYGLMLAVPLLGWAYSNAAGFPVAWFGLWPLPNLVPKDPAWADLLKALHTGAAWTLAALMLGHVAAALKRHFIDRDALLARMRWP